MPRYVPVLRTKPAEWDALRHLTGDVRRVITPCLEILPAELNVSEQSASEDGEHPVTLLGRAAITYGLKPIFTVGLYHDSKFQVAAREVINIHKRGVAIRLFYGDLGKDTSHDGIDSLLHVLEVTYSEADLFVDCGVVGDTPADYDWLSSRVPRLHDWRRFIALGGSFPPNLDGLVVGARALPRYDWLHWHAWAVAPKPRTARMPDFSDYTIQHAVFDEPPQGANPSASIRYTADTYWLVMRGEALRNKKNAGNRQYYGNAQLLSEHDQFKGPTYSFGDRYIWDAANRRGGPGTPTTWLAAGINHHITIAANQVAAL